MKRIKITMQIDYGEYGCVGTNIYEYKNESELKELLVHEYFKVLELRYNKLNINCFIGYEVNNTIIEYNHEDFINDLIKIYLKTNDEDGDIYFLILDKMESSKSLEEFTSYINGIKDGLVYAE